ncbi:MAG TPA: metal ABC transporter ATP-binding protein, partial [Elusimicrobiales bacterium]|nr:metal ABC transporter ATP-binding protein [Elusimicrobiales bacterium]
VEGLYFRYPGGRDVFGGVEFSVDKGDCLVVLGPNGSGKTTLLKTLLGLEQPYEGSIDLFGIPLNGFSDWSRVAYLPQNTRLLNPHFPATAAEVAALGLLSAKKFPRRFTELDMEKARLALDKVGLAARADSIYGELSGGQQQRVLLARLLVGEPELLLLDEPSSALDNDSRGLFFSLLDAINAEGKSTVIWITHDMGEAGKHATKLLYLDGKMRFCGAMGEFCRSNEMERLLGPFTQHTVCHMHDGERPK